MTAAGPARADAFDLAGLLEGLDAIFSAQRGLTDAEPYLLDGLARAQAVGDQGAELSILNELLGLYRSLGRHDAGADVAVRALALADALGLAGTDAYATTLINVATALRAAGRHADALEAYQSALATARATMAPTDRRLAALHNNLAILHGETGDKQAAADALLAALAILEASSVDPGGDLDVAGTLTNLALASHDLGRADDAREYSRRSLDVFARGGHEANPHYAAALAGHAEASFRMGSFDDAVVSYRRALAIVEASYGRDSDAYAVTAENLAQAEAAASAAPTRVEAVTAAPAPAPSSESPAPASAVRGLALARAYWEQHGRPMIERNYPEYRGRIAAGLMGHGSECYGFDDAASRDHDFGAGFCLWLTAEDYARIGERLQADYDALPAEFDGVGPRAATRRASGQGRRVGVFEVGAFFESITGMSSAPAAASPHEWLMIDEATLAAATNGAIFADPLGRVSAARDSFRRMPADVRLALIGRRLGMMAQAGQYNVPRMLDRGEGEAAWLAVGEFVRAAASAVFLLNGPSSVGYLPYYKWQFAALRDLALRPASRLPDVHPLLADAVRLASAACLGGAGFGEGGKGAAPARAELQRVIEAACASVAAELRAQRLSDATDAFLEPHRDSVQSRIGDAWLRGL